VVSHAELLRESSLAASIPVDLAAVTDAAVDPRIPGGRELLAFTDAAIAGEPGETARTRSALIERLGPDRMVEAAAVCACLEMMNRITLATGIPLSRGRMVRTAEVRAAAGLDVFIHG
jgi:hypothetical protein